MLNTLTRMPLAPAGPALVFLHYYGGSIRSWDAVVDQLAGTFRCLIVDLPGFGDSPPLSAHQNVDDVADEVAGAIGEQLAGDPFVLIGHSMGGKIALAIAAGTSKNPQPTGLQAILLLAPSPPGQEPISDQDRQDMINQPGLPPDEQRKTAEKTAEKITNGAISDDVRQQIITDNLRSSPEGWVAWPAIGSRDDITDRMSRIQVPVQILAGDQDRALPYSVQPEMVQPYLPQAGLQTIIGAGHLLPQEVPDVVVAAIKTLYYPPQWPEFSAR